MHRPHRTCGMCCPFTIAPPNTSPPVPTGGAGIAAEGSGTLVRKIDVKVVGPVDRKVIVVLHVGPHVQDQRSNDLKKRATSTRHGTATRADFELDGKDHVQDRRRDEATHAHVTQCSSRRAGAMIEREVERRGGGGGGQHQQFRSTHAIWTRPDTYTPAWHTPTRDRGWLWVPVARIAVG